jgi:hypothetical protein
LPQKSSRKFTYIYRKVCTGTCKNIVVLLLTLNCVALYGQSDAIHAPKLAINGPSRVNTGFGANLSPVNSNTTPKVRVFNAYDLSRSSYARLTLTPISQDLYVRNFGFFCKKELQVEKTTKLPIRFRLGSLAQCNELEQKR